MAQKAQLFDVVLSDGSFFCQLRYTGQPFPKIIEGNVVPSYDTRDLKRFAKETPIPDRQEIRCIFNQPKSLLI